MSRFAFYLSGFFLFFLPFHAFFVTWFSHLLLKSSSDFLPLSSLFIASWKEIILLILGFCFLVKWIQEKRFPIKFHIFDFLFFTFLVVSIFSALFITQDISYIFWGFKYDFEFFLLFYLLRGLAFFDQEKASLIHIFFFSSFIIILWGLVHYFFLPKDFLLSFGYSEYVSSFNPNKPLPVYHILEGTDITRLASTFSGPNQYGFYLLIIFSFLLVQIKDFLLKGKILFSKIFKSKISYLSFVICYLSFVIASLFLTFSRAAWLAALAVLFIFLFLNLPRVYKKLLFWGGAGLSSLCILLLLFSSSFSQMILREGSNSEHLQQSVKAFHQVIENPYGVGIGKAGPASVRFEALNTITVPIERIEAFVQKGLDENVRNEIWLYDNNPKDFVDFKPKNIQELKSIAVFQSLSPSFQEEIFTLWDEFYYERIAENWYLQIFQELGWIGGFIFLLLLYSLLVNLYKKSIQNKNNNFIQNNIASTSFLALSGFATSALFLHSFADASSVLTLFFLLGLVDFDR